MSATTSRGSVPRAERTWAGKHTSGANVSMCACGAPVLRSRLEEPREWLS